LEDQAHAELLEEASASGPPLGELPAIAAATGRPTCELPRSSGRGSSSLRAFPLYTAAAAGLVAFLAHALVDFPVRIPALALSASILAGALWRVIAEIEEESGLRASRSVSDSAP
jgi:hypothetical protein